MQKKKEKEREKMKERREKRKERAGGYIEKENILVLKISFKYYIMLNED